MWANHKTSIVGFLHFKLRFKLCILNHFIKFEMSKKKSEKNRRKSELPLPYTTVITPQSHKKMVWRNQQKYVPTNFLKKFCMLQAIQLHWILDLHMLMIFERIIFMYKAIYLYICLKTNKQTRTEFVGLFVCVFGYTFRSALTHRAEI